MINLNAIKVAQSLNLATGQMDNILVLQFPDGSEVNAVVHESVVDKVIELTNGKNFQAQVPAQASSMQERLQPPAFVAPAAPAPAPEPEPAPQEASPAPASDGPPAEISWDQIPEHVLPMRMKLALRYLNVPPKLTVTALRNLIAQVNERFGEEEWAEVMAKHAAEQANPQPVPVWPGPGVPRTTGLQRPQNPQPPPRPPIGQVTWADGSPMIPGQGNRGPHVPVNEKGYPIVAGATDPGEVVGSGEDSDEDGVGQF